MPSQGVAPMTFCRGSTVTGVVKPTFAAYALASGMCLVTNTVTPSA